MKAKKGIPTTIKFPEPKPIDYRKFIEPAKQVLVNTNKGAIAILVKI